MYSGSLARGAQPEAETFIPSNDYREDGAGPRPVEQAPGLFEANV